MADIRETYGPIWAFTWLLIFCGFAMGLVVGAVLWHGGRL